MPRAPESLHDQTLHEPSLRQTLAFAREAHAGAVLAGGQPRWTRALAVMNLLPTVLPGIPSVSVPTGVVGGLPTGVQVVAPRWREDLALDAAEVIEAAWPMPTPVEPQSQAD